MPMFEYACRTCGHRFETFLRSSAAPPPPCPRCQGEDLEKQFSVFGMGGAASRGGGVSFPAGGG
jgi:putative regulatory protein, FmdB family